MSAPISTRTGSDSCEPGRARRMSAEERAVIARLLEPEFPGSAQLRMQLASARVADLDSDGSLKFLIDTTLPRAPVLQRVATEAEAVDGDGVPVAVLLHVVDGMLDELEVFRGDSGPLLNPIRADSLTVVPPQD